MRRKKLQTLMVIVNLGLLASATSTSGLVNKMVGRIGDTPIIGAWTYANNLCEVSATAKAEAIIRGTVARDVAALMEFKGVSLIEAPDYVAVVEEGAPKGNVGLVAVSAVGEVTIYAFQYHRYVSSLRH
ncbi:hypothetical protein EV1_015574 [Malus domestica]|uniref:isoaspartyl peptidase/L-asparaginase-like n=1 Tax=Malus domestica TaxID=3750 RepID=UPI0010AA9E3F|nr:isoaspartyl peptidase/L-asparaginase-like [Malus domestica]